MLPPPPPPPPPYTPEQGLYILPTGTQASAQPEPVPGHVYVGYTHNARSPRIAAWVGPEPIVFIGAELALGQVYFTVVAPYARGGVPTAHVWKWLRADQWQYLGELPTYI